MSFSLFQRSWRPARFALWLGLVAGSLALPGSLRAVTLDQLMEDPKLTAKKYASYFSDFIYEFSAPIQSPNLFLARNRGDCDDYAVLADFVLKKHGQKTRLVHVRLTGRVAHAVCYVEDNKAYLDYNNRNVFFTLTKSGASLRDVADKVARSFDATWTTASEFSYSYITQRKTMITTVSQTGETVPTPPPPTTKPNPFHVE